MCSVLEREAAGAGALGECLDVAVVAVAAAVEDDAVDARLLGALGEPLADGLGRVDADAGLSSSRVLAAASVVPAASSMSWA